MSIIGKKTLVLLGFVCYNANAFQNPTFKTRTSLKLDANMGDDSLSFENAVRNGWKPDRGHFVGLRRKTSTAREMSDDGAVMPDGGLSPCIIKVVGVGGGGCNAVSNCTKLKIL